MDQLRDFADSRLLNGCIHCGAPAETRDHVPSRCLLERPYPENLPAVSYHKSSAFRHCNFHAAIGNSLDFLL